ncbi:hypothetical protein MC885_010674 [Smutsia gigantea]|nr:hypothetical protein MC885_010674 [Smutsia gigantea]
MEYPVMETGSLFTSGNKRHVKDKRISKTSKLNVSLASKIKTKIINNSSIFKISLKHNNRALAQALSKEKENSRRITTEKMLLQKEVEKLNFENTFLRLKLNNLNKKLIEIEALMNNNLITAIEMSTLSEFHQSPFLLPTSKKKRVSKQCKLMRLPFARVPLTSNDDDDDEDKEKMQRDNNIMSKTSLDSSSLVSKRQPLSAQYNSESFFPKENNQNVFGLDDSEHISSVTDTLPKESHSHSHSDKSSKCSLKSEMKSAQLISHKEENPFPSNITERKKRLSSWESNNPSADSPCLTDLGQQWISSTELHWNNEIKDPTNEANIPVQRSIQCLPDSCESASDPTAEFKNQGQSNEAFQLQKTVYDADMDLTATEVSTIVTVSTNIKNKSNARPNDCGIKPFRKVKDASSDRKRERKRKLKKNSSDMDIEDTMGNGPAKRSVVLDGKGDSEDPNFIFSTEQLTQLNTLKKITLPNGCDQDDRQSTRYNKKKKRTHVTNEQEEIHSFSQSSDKAQQESIFGIGQSSVADKKCKTSRQTFVIHKLEKDNLFPNQKDKETTSENLEVTNEFQTADLPTKDNGSLFDYETQNMLDLKRHVIGMQPAQQNESKINKLRQKVNRKMEIISVINHICGNDAKDVHGPENGNFSFETQQRKETISGNLETSNEFQKPSLFVIGNGNLCDYETQNVLDLQKQITDVYPVHQNESKVNKNLRQKVNRKTEIISEVNYLDNDKNLFCLERSNSFFLTQKDEEVIPENLKDPSEFQTPALSTKDSGNLYDCDPQNVLGVKKHVHDRQPAYQNESKIGKLRQKVNRKTEIISEVYQLCGDNDEDVHGPEICTKDLDFEINESKQRLECQGIISGHCMESNSNEKENCDQVSNPYKLVKKPRKESSGKTKNILAKGKNKPILHLTDSSLTSISVESGLKHINEADSDPGNQMEPHKNPEQKSTTSLNKRGDIPFVEGMKGECQVKKVNKMTSKSKKRKTFIDPSPGRHEVMGIISDNVQEITAESEQANAEKNLENEKIVKIQPDSYTKVSKSLSPINSPNIQNTSFNSIHKDSIPLSISSSKNLIIEENFVLECPPIVQVSDDVHEKMKGMKFKVNRRTQKSEIGGRTLQDLTNTSFVSNNMTKSENKSEDLSLDLPSRRRRCTPLCLKEPSLKG